MEKTPANELGELRAELTHNQRIFCDEYMIDRNGTRAYQVAYPHIKNAASAAVMASKLLRKPKIKRYIDARMAEVARENEITVSRVLEEEARLAFSDIREIFDGETTIAPGDLPEDVARALAGIKKKDRDFYDNDGNVTETHTTYEYKFWDKGKALQRLERHLGMDGQGDESVEKGLRELGDRLERAIRRTARDRSS